jgi:hypothetical protein
MYRARPTATSRSGSSHCVISTSAVASVRPAARQCATTRCVTGAASRRKSHRRSTAIHPPGLTCSTAYQPAVSTHVARVPPWRKGRGSSPPSAHSGGSSRRTTASASNSVATSPIVASRGDGGRESRSVTATDARGLMWIRGACRGGHAPSSVFGSILSKAPGLAVDRDGRDATCAGPHPRVHLIHIKPRGARL